MKKSTDKFHDNVLSFTDLSQIQDLAGTWLVRLDSGELTQGELTAFREWLQSDSRHKKVFIELTVLWERMEVLNELSELFPLPETTGTRRSITRHLNVFDPMPVAAALFIIMLIGLGTYLAFVFSTPESANPALIESVFRTTVGEQSIVKLPDGSDTTLNTDSVLEVAYNPEQRNIRLVKGEAHFVVVHKDSRPFVVHAGTGIIRAVGTAFSVHIKGEAVEVVVAEGSVEIASSAGISVDSFIDLDEIEPDKFLTTVTAGHTAEYGNKHIHSVLHVEPELISRKLSWQHGMLVFEGNPLDEVVAEISRYTSTEIIISDPAIRGIRVGGYFRTGETEALLTVLQNNFSIHVERVNDNLIYLSGTEIRRAVNGQ